MPSSNILRVGIVVAGFIAAAMIAIYADRGPGPDLALTLSDVAPVKEDTSYDPERSRIRVAVAPVLSPQATLESYEELVAYLEKRLDQPTELVLGKSYGETNALMRSGDVSIAIVCSGAFVVGRREFGMEALAIPVVNGKTTYRSYLIVPERSRANSWQDLQNKVFAFTDPLSNTGRLVPLYILSQTGHTPDSFFRDFIFTYSHDKSIQAVAEGLVDGAAVDSLVYDFLLKQDQSLAVRARVIWRSVPYGINPVVVHPDMQRDKRLQIEKVFLGMGTDPEGREVLGHLGIDAFVKPEPGAYGKIEAMMRATGLR